MQVILTEDEYNALKRAVDAGLSPSEIATRLNLLKEQIISKCPVVVHGISPDPAVDFSRASNARDASLALNRPFGALDAEEQRRRIFVELSSIKRFFDAAVIDLRRAVDKK